MTAFPVPQLQDFLSDSARRIPDKVALVCGGERVTYGDLDARSNALAHALERHGVTRGDRVVVLLDNSVEAAVAFWAVLKANAIVCMAHPQTKADKLAYMLNDCRAAALVSERRLAAVCADAAARSEHLRGLIVAGGTDHACRLDRVQVSDWHSALSGVPSERPPRRSGLDVDLAAIIYTSGSTGEPAGVMLTHRNMLSAATSITALLGMVEDDVVLNVLPMSFDYGLYQMIMTFKVGGRLVLEKSFAYPARVLTRIVAERVTAFPGVPTIFATLADLRSLDDYDFSAIRFVTNTAAALPVKHILMLKDLFPGAAIFSMYGLTECKRCTWLPPKDLDRKPTSVGVAIPNTEIWIVDDDGNRVGPGTVGQLVIRGATVMRGYWGKPEKTAEKIRPGPIPGETVLYTGDYCTMDDEGYLYFVSRMDDIIKSRGEKVSPKEIEAVLCHLEGVHEAAVIGVPDEILGAAPKAFLVPERGKVLDPRKVRRLCQEKLEGFLVPKYFEVVASLPKNPNGKIDKRALS